MRNPFSRGGWMPRDVPLGNGRLLVNFDRSYRISDIYTPRIGKENQTSGHPFRFGAWRGGRFAWMGEGDLQPGPLLYEEDTLVTRVVLTSPGLGVQITFRDIVDFNESVFLRLVETAPLEGPGGDEIRLFFHQDFHLLETGIGDSATYEPEFAAIRHFKDDRHVLVGGLGPAGPFQEWAVGLRESRGFEGTWKDAEDGRLEMNPVAQGAVDSTVSFHLKVGESMWYWLAFGESRREVADLQKLIHEKHPATLLDRTRAYWRLWSKAHPPDLSCLDPRVATLYRRSLLTVRTQVDEGGGILAASDWDIVRFGQDTYDYVWGRDGALVADALDQGGHDQLTDRFFSFICPLIEKDGYLGHKYNVDGTPGSTWHPSWRDGWAVLPIQEDETALVLWALWRNFARHHQVETLKPFYRPFIIRAADFLLAHRDHETGLPLPSYDLWEERWGIHAFTVGSVVAGLAAASRFARSFGEEEAADRYGEASETMCRQFFDRFFHADSGRLARMVSCDPGGHMGPLDLTPDSALLGLSEFDEIPLDDRVTKTWQTVRDALRVVPSGGLARYVNDPYQQAIPTSMEVPGNPWFISTLWGARTIIRTAKSREDLKAAERALLWCADHALPSGIMAEQIHPETHEPLSVSPLTWSHSAFVSTTLAYAERWVILGASP